MTTSTLLLGTATATAAFHTLIPDHWLPFVLVGRARSWSAGVTAFVAGSSAVVHTGLSVALGVVAIAMGEVTAEAIGARLERASGVLLVVFGLAYALWAWRKGGHFHPGGALLHRHEPEPHCHGEEGPENPEHMHYHADDGWIRAGKGALGLALIVGLNPCVLILPIMIASVGQGTRAVALVAGAYSVTTTALMVGLSVVGVVGARRIPVPAAARHMEAASGLLIAIVGFAVLALAR